MPDDTSPLNSPQRLKALSDSGLTDPSVDPSLDRLTRLITTALRVPVALVSLVDSSRQFFKSQCGLHEPWAMRRETPLTHSFCQHVVHTDKPLIINDARTNPLVAKNLAVSEIGVIAYAGVPIRDSDGQTLGSLCAIDGKPREWTADDIELLSAMSMQISSDIQIRKQSLALAAELKRQRAIADNRQSMLRLDIHDLRTPLTALLLGMETLDLLGPLNADQVEYLDLSRRNGQALLTIVNNLLDIDMMEQRGAAALFLKPCDPSALLADAVEQVRPLAVAKKLTIRTATGDSPATMHADSDRLTRVLVNLLGNAIKFTDDGGEVEASIAEAGTRVTFSVRDSGIGMAEADHIFDEGVKLDTTSATPRSTGLGLTFCKRVVEAHGGRIGFESQLHVGSTFFFDLPA